MQEFEFSNLEFLKPTRMNKVYIVFACNILDQDLLWLVYNIPTVGICRAEQRAKACQKLGIAMHDANGHAESQVRTACRRCSWLRALYDPGQSRWC